MKGRPTEFVEVDLAKIGVKEFLHALGVMNVTHESEGNFRYSCIFPEHDYGDKSPSAYMRQGSTTFICHSCGRTGNAITMLADVKQVSRLKARRWIAEKWNPAMVEIEDLAGYIVAMMTKAVDEIEDEDAGAIDEGNLAERNVDWAMLSEISVNAQEVPGWAEYMLGRALYPETLSSFDVCYDEASDRPAITVRDVQGRLVGFKARAWREGQFPKYMVLGDTDRTIAERGEVYGFPPYDASAHVFGLHKIPKGADLILREGELNVMMMHQLGYENTCGPSGSSFSAAQVKLIVDHTDHVILFMDADLGDPGKEATAQIKVLKAIDAFAPYVRVSVAPPSAYDPMEMTSDEVATLLAAAVPSTLYRIRNLLAG